MSNLSLSNLIEDPVSRRTIQQQWNERTIILRFIDSFSPLESFLESEMKRFIAFWRTNLPMLRIQNETSLKGSSPLPACFCWKKIPVFYQQNGINYFNCLVDQATPGFELGKKDLQSPALPLGHAAKTIQKKYENTPPSKKMCTFSQKS